VELVGYGVFLVDQARRLVEAFDEGVANGLLMGSGAGNSATNRRDALGAMLVEATSLLEGGFVSESCGQLHAALMHSDGEAHPGDFVVGPAAPVVADEIRGLRENMGCWNPGRWNCGLGFELVFLLPPLVRLGSRARRTRA
jgi:hypothetical protein